MKQVIYINIHSCARCGGLHEKLLFSPFTSPVTVANVEFTYYATCPDTNEPILLRVTVEDN